MKLARQSSLVVSAAVALSVSAWAQGQGTDFAGPNTKLVPGHGTIINRADIVPYRDMILGVQAKVQQMIAQGKTEQEVLAAKVTAPYDAKVPGGLLPAGAGTSADRFVSMVYLQLKGGR